MLITNTYSHKEFFVKIVKAHWNVVLILKQSIFFSKEMEIPLNIVIELKKKILIYFVLYKTLCLPHFSVCSFFSVFPGLQVNMHELSPEINTSCSVV